MMSVTLMPVCLNTPGQQHSGCNDEGLRVCVAERDDQFCVYRFWDKRNVLTETD